MVKEKAPALLRQELSSPKWRPAPIGMSGVTDCYQPIERRLKLTRQCLETKSLGTKWRFCWCNKRSTDLPWCGGWRLG
jgi:hypothetical protein